MQAIQPKMNSLKERYKDNAEKLHKETMELFKRNRVNPMAGCLPMLVQMPVLIAMYHLLSEAVELQGAPFVGWMHDLSQPDRLFMLPFTIPFLGWDAFNLLPLFMIASQYGFQKIMPQPSTSPDQAMMFKFMPVMFGFISYNMPSGLVLYWSLQNLLSIGHHMLVSRSPIDLHHEDKA
jgi:YidC/Oxa1 family membrane protein insertase